MSFAALGYLGAVKTPIRQRANEVLTVLYSGKHVTLTHVWGLNPGNDGDHGNGRALDFMVFENAAAGHYIANYLMANAKRLGVRYIMWNHRIWNIERDKYGAWRWVADRGSVTENHLDHVHVSFYESAKGSYVPPTTPPPVVKPPTVPGLPSSWFLAEDGKNGLGTRKAVQRMIGVTGDGNWGPATRKQLQRWINGLSAARGWKARLTIDGDLGPATRRQLQAVLGLRMTGVWDWDQSSKADPTTKALQAYYNRAVRNRRKPY